jgi:hypothetical protein
MRNGQKLELIRGLGLWTSAAIVVGSMIGTGAAEIHPKFRTPGGALAFECVLASVFALSGTFEELTSLFVFAL